jgi:hypothetical protein
MATRVPATKQLVPPSGGQGTMHAVAAVPQHGLGVRMQTSSGRQSAQLTQRPEPGLAQSVAPVTVCVQPHVSLPQRVTLESPAQMSAPAAQVPARVATQDPPWQKPQAQSLSAPQLPPLSVQTHAPSRQRRPLPHGPPAMAGSGMHRPVSELQR